MAVCFCGPIRQIAPPRVLPDAMPCGARTFLDCNCRRGHPTSLGNLMIPAMQPGVNRLDLGYNQAWQGMLVEIINPYLD